MHELIFQKGEYYICKRGQTIGEISRMLDVSPYDLIEKNEITCVFEGLILSIPKGSSYEKIGYMPVSNGKEKT